MGVVRILVAMYLVLSFIAEPMKGNWSSLLVDMFSSGGLNVSCAMCVLH